MLLFGHIGKSCLMFCKCISYVYCLFCIILKAIMIYILSILVMCIHVGSEKHLSRLFKHSMSLSFQVSLFNNSYININGIYININYYLNEY